MVAALVGWVICGGCGDRQTQSDQRGAASSLKTPASGRTTAAAPVSANWDSELVAEARAALPAAQVQTQASATSVSSVPAGVAAAVAGDETAPSASSLPKLSISKPASDSACESRRHCRSDHAANAKITLFVLDPSAGAPVSAPDAGFLGWRVLAQAEVEVESQRREVLAAVVRGCRSTPTSAHWNSTVGGGELAAPAGFTPARGVRVLREGRTADYLVSRDGARVQVYEYGRLVRETEASEDLGGLLDGMLGGVAGAGGHDPFAFQDEAEAAEMAERMRR